MVNKMVSVSAVLPAYNAERWVGRAIESVLQQTVKPTEILVIDDGSEDGTPRAAQQYGAVRYLRQPNAGPSAARNRGIAQARSEWIAFLDADDEWLPHKTELQWRILERNPDLRWCGSASGDAGEEGASSPGPREGTGPESVPEERLPFFGALLRHEIRIGTPGMIIHRSVFDQVGTFDPELRSGEDIDLWCRIALSYPQIGFCFDPCWRRYQDNPCSASRKGRVRRDRAVDSFCKNMRRALELGPEAVSEFRPYARKKVLDNLLREAARDCLISSEISNEVKRVFPLRMYERALLRILRLLPQPLAVRIVAKLRDRVTL